MNKDKPQLDFSLIDAKNYPPVSGHNFNTGDVRATNSEKNLKIILAAEREYLERLAELQQAIRDKFEPQMEEEPEKDDFDTDDRWTIETNFDSNTPKRNKNIDNLYYT